MASGRGPRGLETPASYAGAARLGAAAAVFVFAIGFAQWEKYVGWTNPLTGDRMCGEPPSEIAVWSLNHRDRRPEDADNLETWAARHRDRINEQYGPSCETPLHAAAKFGRDDLAELLIAAGADVEAADEYDDRPLHAAAVAGRPAVVTLLLRHRADVDARGSGGKTPLHAAADGLGRTTDIDAQLEVAKLLLAAGADVNAHDRSGGFTPLHAASGWGRPGSKAMTELLLSYGADPGGGGSQGPPLVNVAMTGNLEAMQLLLDRRADPNAAGIDTTALGGAAYGGHVDAVRLLLDEGAAVDRRVRGSRLEWQGLPLAMALAIARASDADVMSRRRDAARLLLRRGADPDERNRAGETMVHRMASEGDAGALDLVLSCGGHASARDEAGFTPLHAAARHGRIEAARRLLAAGASPHAPAGDGTTPLDLASADAGMTALLRRGAAK